MARMPSPVVEVPDFWVWHEMALERGWTDGLVVAPPTRERVDQMIAYLGRRPDEVVGILGPKDGIATIEQIAINCVMAGCLPQHAPVVIAADRGDARAGVQPARRASDHQSLCAAGHRQRADRRRARIPCQGRRVRWRLARQRLLSVARCG